MFNITKLLIFINVLFICSMGIAGTSGDIGSANSRRQELEKEKKLAFEHRNLVYLYRPNYVLPYYHTGSPYRSIYIGNTPDSQRLKRTELKGQLSFMVPIYNHSFYGRKVWWHAAYTQLMYWQVYTRSPYFRETNYEPELFLQWLLDRSKQLQFGVYHQSNGRGGELERSWNRAYAELDWFGINYLLKIRAWTLIAKGSSSDLHNPDIAHFLGYENILFSYNFDNLKATGEVQNIESGLKRGFFKFTLSYPFYKHLHIYAQYFTGYGQSLIEYNHKTSSFGIGFALNDWVTENRWG